MSTAADAPLDGVAVWVATARRACVTAVPTKPSSSADCGDAGACRGQGRRPAGLEKLRLVRKLVIANDAGLALLPAAVRWRQAHTSQECALLNFKPYLNDLTAFVTKCRELDEERLRNESAFAELNTKAKEKAGQHAGRLHTLRRLTERLHQDLADLTCDRSERFVALEAAVVQADSAAVAADEELVAASAAAASERSSLFSPTLGFGDTLYGGKYYMRQKRAQDAVDSARSCA